MCANSEGSDLYSLAWAFAGHLYDKYHNLMSWLIYSVCLIYDCEKFVVLSTILLTALMALAG